MTQTFRTMRVAGAEEGVLSVVIDAPPMNLIGPELVRDLVTLHMVEVMIRARPTLTLRRRRLPHPAPHAHYTRMSVPRQAECCPPTSLRRPAAGHVRTLPSYEPTRTTATPCLAEVPYSTRRSWASSQAGVRLNLPIR
jgi:hypothetical protein